MEVDLSKPIREQLVPLTRASREEIPGNVSPTTVSRWGQKGLLGIDGQRIRLQIWLVGRVPHTTRAAIAEFLEQVTAARTAKLESNESGMLTATDTDLKNAGLL
jgi:hypothetical protein